MMPGDPTRPRLSVAIAAWTGREALARCLDSLRAEIRVGEDEIVVARNFAVAPGTSAGAPCPAAADLFVAADATVPQLRAAALAATQGAIVAFIEDHCTCAPGWRDAIVRAHAANVAAVGGPVDLAPGGRPLDWAVYFYDYARFAPPLRPGPTRALSGANMSYKRALLDDMRANLAEGVVETALERACRDRGSAMQLAADAVVIHRSTETPGHAIGLAFGLARGYAADRVRGAPAVRRLAFACATPMLPLLLVGRILAAVLRTRRKAVRFVRASPWLAVLLVAWAMGEFAGYALGEGDSARRWR